MSEPTKTKFDLSSLAGVLSFYKDPTIPYEKKPEIIYKCFEHCAEKHIPLATAAFKACDGFGEVAFLWVWYILIECMTNKHFKFLEVGVYKGRTLAMISLIAQHLQRHAEIYGVTPLTDAADKYSKYTPGMPESYLYAIKNNIWIANSVAASSTPFLLGKPEVRMPSIIKGFSQEYPTICETANRGPYDIVYIDGCHDYEVVVSDIKHYGSMIKQGGFLVMDDASSEVPHAFGQFLGHPDVARAVRDTLSNDKTFVELMTVGHMRVWYKVGLTDVVTPVDNSPGVCVIEPRIETVGDARAKQKLILERGPHCGDVTQFGA